MEKSGSFVVLNVEETAFPSEVTVPVLKLYRDEARESFDLLGELIPEHPAQASLINKLKYEFLKASAYSDALLIHIQKLRYAIHRFNNTSTLNWLKQQGITGR